MANKAAESAATGSTVLTIIWLLVSAGLAYPVYSMLASWGVNSALAVTLVFIGICLLYDIPYRARVKAQHAATMSRSDHLRSRSY